MSDSPFNHIKGPCNCPCHNAPGIMHIMPCCQFTGVQRTDTAGIKAIRDQVEAQLPKKTGLEWAAEEGVTIMDPDGWHNAGISLDHPISHIWYRHLLADSTISMPMEAINAAG